MTIGEMSRGGGLDGGCSAAGGISVAFAMGAIGGGGISTGSGVIAGGGGGVDTNG